MPKLSLRTIGGGILVLVGVAALLTPLTPGSWLLVIGLQLLGVRLLTASPMRTWFSMGAWKRRFALLRRLRTQPRFWIALLTSAGVLLLFIVVAYTRPFAPAPTPLPSSEISALQKRRLSVGNSTLTVELARTSDEHVRGLSNRNVLDSSAGMLFLFPAQEKRTFWMKDTKIPLDILWIRESRVIGITANMLPQPGVPDLLLRRYTSPEPVDQVLEVNAGWVARYGIRIGDTVRFSESTSSMEGGEES